MLITTRDITTLDPHFTSAIEMTRYFTEAIEQLTEADTATATALGAEFIRQNTGDTKRTLLLTGLLFALAERIGAIAALTPDSPAREEFRRAIIPALAHHSPWLKAHNIN